MRWLLWPVLLFAIALAGEEAAPDGPHAEAEDALNDDYVMQGIRARVPRTADGGLDWEWRGPKDSPEWAWFFHRHAVIDLWLEAYRETNDPKYAQAINAYLEDWLEHNPPPGTMSFSAGWRALEVARRIDGPWYNLWFAPERGEILSPEVGITMYDRIREHGDYLRRHHSFSGNHRLTELSILVRLALAWPEFEEADDWLSYGLEEVRVSLDEQVYPDGAYKELANHYQRVALQSYQRLLGVLETYGRKAELREFKPRIEKMWDYWAGVMRPNGRGPLNNDSDLEENRELLLGVADFYGREDWKAMASRGALPVEGIPSRIYPWAGHVIARESWKPVGWWAFFDAGPHGTDHQHRDRLHLSLSWGDRDYLVDAGRYHYQRDRWRDYFAGPRGHNVLLLDGRAVEDPPDAVSEPMRIDHRLSEEGLVASASAPWAGAAGSGRGLGRHTREIRMRPSEPFEVVDEVVVFGAHELEALWHFHPDIRVEVSGHAVIGRVDGAPDIRLELLEGDLPEVELVRGERAPVQGWYSAEFNERVEATTVRFRGRLLGPMKLHWRFTSLEGQ